MSDSLKKGLIPIVLVFLILIGVLYFLSTRESYGQVVARVNGESVTRRDVIEAIEKTDDNFKLNAMIDRSIIEQLAQKNNINVSDTELIVGINNEVNNITRSGEPLEKYLNDHNMTKKEFDDQVKYSILQGKIMRGGAVTEEEITDYIDNHKSEYPAGPADETNRQEVRIMLQAKITVEGLRKKFEIKTYPLFK